MPLFMAEEDLLQSDPSSVAARADEVILDLRRQLETALAEADAASIASDQTHNVLEQRYASLSAELARAQAEAARASAAAEQHLSEIAEAQAAKHDLNIKSIAKDGEIQRLKLELSELQKSNRKLLDLISVRDTEIGEKNSVIQSYHDKIVKLTENASEKESKLQEYEAEVNRSRATCARLLQEKELVEKHNNWLNEELTDKVNSLIELRRTSMEAEADMAAKIEDAERRFTDCSKSLKQSEERVREYSTKLAAIEEELSSCKDVAASNERQYSAELSTVSKLAELYKENSEAWSKKSADLEGVIKALETHLSQVDSDYRSKLEEAASIRNVLEKDIQDTKEKLGRCEIELEKARKSSERNLLLGSSLYTDALPDEVHSQMVEFGNQGENFALDVARRPAGISGTALAASLLRDGWSLAKMYEKYQEAADAVRHERWGRKHTEAILERVLHEIEEKADIILEERVEHEKMVEAYSSLNKKLQQAQSEHDAYEISIRNLKAELKQREHDYNLVQKENIDLQRQVAVLLKECRDIQVRCGMASNETWPSNLSEDVDAIDVEQEGLTFKGIMDLVQQNCQLRSLVHNLSSAEETRLSEMQEKFQMELQKQENVTASKVEAVLKRCEEQGLMIESLHSSVAMYKKLYEQEQNARKSSYASKSVSEGNNDFLLLFEGTQEASRKAHEDVMIRTRSLEQDLSNLRNEFLATKLERDKFMLEAKHAREKLDGFMIDFDRQKNESNGVLARNVELSQLIIDHQRKLRESADSLRASEERCRKLFVEVSTLKNEREILSSSEKRASDEIRDLTERVYRLQSSLDTFQGVEKFQEESRSRERRRLEEHVHHVEKEWADAKKELQEQRDRVRVLEAERERALEDSMKQVNDMQKKLVDALQAVTSAEARASSAEGRLASLDNLMKTVDEVAASGKESTSCTLAEKEEIGHLWKVRDELERTKEEADANKAYMLQYKEIANTNEVALKQIEFAHEEFRSETEKLRHSLESEILSLREKVAELESQCIAKTSEAFSANVAKENALSSAAFEFEQLKVENANNVAKSLEMESQISSLKENLEREHERWRSSQNNYERQVILQSETIQELSKTSQALASLQAEMTKLRNETDVLKSENELLKSSWQKEKSSLLKEKEEAERKLKEINEQNKILHKRLENLHLENTDREPSLGHSTGGDHMENDLRSVVSYLRRAKEIAETEITLLRQEKLRLQSQLDVALKSSESAQALLHSERENAKERMYTDDEFSSLKLQVREINLFRESNAELRAENQHNFEECQRLHEIVQQLKVECDRISRENDIAIHDYQKEVDMLKSEKLKVERDISDLSEKYKNVDVEEIDRVKDELQRTLIKLKESASETDMLKTVLAEKQECLLNRECRLMKCQKDLEEHQKKISGFVQVEIKVDQLLKEKEDLLYENRSLHKQLEESLAVKKLNVGVAINAVEKDTRIQMLEKLVEKERESLRKEKEENKREKARSMTNEKFLIDLVQMVIQERRKFEDDIKTHKISVPTILEGYGISATQLPMEGGLEESIAYFFSMYKNEDAVNTALGDVDDAASLLPSESNPKFTGRQILRASNRPGTSTNNLDRPMEKDLVKTNNDGRKTVRKLNRPRLKQSEESVDAEILETEGATLREGKHIDARDVEDASLPSSYRKRPTSSLVAELKDGHAHQETETSGIPLPKKVKGSESPIKVSKNHVPSIGTLPLMEDASPIGSEAAEPCMDEKPTGTGTGSNQDLDLSRYVVAPETEASTEADVMSMSPEKSHDGTGSLDESLKCDDMVLVSHHISADDNMEGEMASDDLEVQPDEGEQLQLDSAAEVSGFADVEEVALVSSPLEEGGIVTDEAINEPIREQWTSDIQEGQFEPPSDVQTDAATPEQRLPGSVGEPGESQAQTGEGHTPSVSSQLENRPNTRLQASIPARAPARGMARGRLKRDFGRGRGGTSLNDRDRQG